jgi:hypothetical protein
VPVVRIFLSTPSDVAKEHELSRSMIDTELPKLVHFCERMKLGLIAWDDLASHVPMLATEIPQNQVIASRLQPAICDIVTVILYSQKGTPLLDKAHKPNGEPHLSRPKWEYEKALTASEAS